MLTFPFTAFAHTSIYPLLCPSPLGVNPLGADDAEMLCILLGFGRGKQEGIGSGKNGRENDKTPTWGILRTTINSKEKRRGESGTVMRKT